MTRVLPWILTALAAIPVLGVVPVRAQDSPASSDLPAESREFDFWVGQWDVNLRVRQDDLGWEDERRATAMIYPILRGKAVLELWDEPSIKGFSLRYFDVDRDRWVLWLNWPGPNRSGSSSLEGRFRHGRGEFFSVNERSDGTEVISRYSFSDITPSSLRWDDAFSTDGGATWSNSWIMEFSRTGEAPRLPASGGDAHTYHTGDRCDLPSFRRYEFLQRRREGLTSAGASAVMTGYRVLDGCAVLILQRWGEGQRRFVHLTYNTFANRLELLELDSRPETPARIFYSEQDADELFFAERSDGGSATRRIKIEPLEGGGVLWRHEIREDGSWKESWSAEFAGVRQADGVR